MKEFNISGGYKVINYREGILTSLTTDRHHECQSVVTVSEQSRSESGHLCMYVYGLCVCVRD